MKKSRLIVLVIWGALCSSLCLYAVMLNSMTFAPSQSAPGSMGRIIALTAGSATVLSFLLRRLLLGGFTSGVLSADDPEQQGRFVAGHVVVFALSEGVGVLGFVNGILSNGKGDAWVPYIGLSLALMLLHIPLPSRFKPAA
jgi:F0F1-type ATP synthase membrane subunit c/vacuolar-type H+-ATPase subunit K